MGDGRPVLNKKRQLCSVCYSRYRKHGDPSITKRPDLGKSLEGRFWEKVNKDGPVPASRPELGPCWVWTAGLNHGYGQFIIMRGKRGAPVRAHRMAWAFVRGEIPDDLDLDHLCRNRPCVNPAHLEPVTNEVNIERGMWSPAVNSRKTYCDYDHEFTPENTYRPPKRPHTRQCRKCMRRREAERRQRRSAA
jgi:hypothetical protein